MMFFLKSIFLSSKLNNKQALSLYVVCTYIYNLIIVNKSYLHCNAHRTHDYKVQGSLTVKPESLFTVQTALTALQGALLIFIRFQAIIGIISGYLHSFLLIVAM